MGTYTAGDKNGLSGLTRALLTLLSLGNIHRSKYLDGEGGSHLHQLPTCLGFSPGDIWAGGTPPRAHSMSGLQGDQTKFVTVDFLCREQDLQPPPGMCWQDPVHRRQLRCCCNSPAAPPCPDKVPAQCHKAPGSSPHHQSYDTEAKPVKITFLCQK